MSAKYFRHSCVAMILIIMNSNYAMSKRPQDGETQGRGYRRRRACNSALQNPRRLRLRPRVRRRAPPPRREDLRDRRGDERGAADGHREACARRLSEGRSARSSGRASGDCSRRPGVDLARPGVHLRTSGADLAGREDAFLPSTRIHSGPGRRISPDSAAISRRSRRIAGRRGPRSRPPRTRPAGAGTFLPMARRLREGAAIRAPVPIEED